MFSKVAKFQGFALKRCVFIKCFPHQYEPLCCAKVPFMLNKAIHTSQVMCRDYAFKAYIPPTPEDHDHKNMRLKRPMSPHLTIYAPTLPAMTSIAQRITVPTLSSPLRPASLVPIPPTCFSGVYMKIVGRHLQDELRVILAFYAIMLSGGALFLSNGIDSYVSMIQSLNLNRFFIFLIKIICGLPFGYHYFCGLRFCMFNIGKLLEKKAVYDSARKAIVAAGVVALIFAMR